MRRILFVLAAVMMSAPVARAASVEELRAKLAALPEGSHDKEKAVISTELGMELYKSGRMEEAAQVFERTLLHDTTRALRRNIYLYMGKSYESSNRLDKAVAAYEEAVTYDKRNWRRHRDLAGLYEQSQLYREAIKSYEKALDLNSNEPSLFVDLGRAWRKLGLYTEAEPWLKKAQAADFRPVEIQREFSLLFEGQGRYLEAAQAWQKSLEADATWADKARLAYLAALAGDKSLSQEGKNLLTKSSKDTVLFYENLVELVSLPPAKIRPDSTDDPNLLALLRSLGSEGPQP